MKGINILNMTAGMAAVLLSVTLFSCSSDVPYEHTDYSTTDNICFGISDSGNGTRAAAANEAITTDRYVLRSSESSDTLCVRAVVSDGIGKAAAKHATRASMQTTMYDQFNVVAQLKKSDGNIAPRYYMNEVATKQGVVWQPSSSIYYWPDNGSLRFLAWAPIDAELDESPVKPSEDVNKTTIKYTVPADLSKQRDLVAAATGYNASPAGGVCAPVSLQFKHLCTAVVVKTGATMAPGTIKSVTVTNVRNSGTYDMLSSAWTLNDATTSYTVSPNMATGSTTAEGTKLNADDATFMLLPQTLGAESKLEVMFHDNISGRDRLLTASLNGAEWPMGKTVTYRLSITPEYELEFTSEPQVQDAHYVIYPIKIKVDPGLTGGWQLKSTSPKVTLRKNLTELEEVGYWIEEDRGTQTIEGTESGDITVYAFLEENVTNAERDVVLELSPKGFPSATPAKFTIRQLCPSWNADGLGCERIEGKKYQWGFLWGDNMKMVYTVPGWILKKWWVEIVLTWFNDYGKYITVDRDSWSTSFRVTIDFNKIPSPNVAKSPTDGIKNSSELYNFNGISDVSALIKRLENWGGTTNQTFPLNPTEFAVRAAVMKNKFNKEVQTSGTETIERPILKNENLVWYLPAKDEFSTLVDDEYPLQGNYWTSTASDISEDDENAYKYILNSGASLEKRTTLLNVRAVRKRP
ncbi:MAG: fimbrillin family protein [Prevotella sp.]|uniref:fimbrillin family protein n=1 Tax=Leyella stercorea TaxID=363265 RepID=UPI0028008E96|nr:fimbrillin family protein [Leyella stercorea]MDY4198528.1 fimbrillin family protein [Prevotella sp.]